MLPKGGQKMFLPKEKGKLSRQRCDRTVRTKRRSAGMRLAVIPVLGYSGKHLFFVSTTHAHMSEL